MVFLGIAVLLGGCQGHPPLPQLLTLLELTPRTFDAGETVEIAGAGFPVKKVARVTFRGSLFRPGKAPETTWEATTEGLAVNPYKIELPVTETFRERLGGVRIHATFRGTMDVAFDPLTAGSLPLTGTLADVTFDLVPASHHDAAAEAQLADARQALQLLGVKLSTDAHAAPAGGLAVAEVAAESPAEAAGLIPGDLLTSLDGLRLLDLPDMVPAGKRSYAVLQAIRPGLPEPLELHVTLRGFKGSRAPDLLGTATLLGTVAALLLLLLSPAARTLTRWESARHDRLPARARPAASPPALALPPKRLVLGISAGCCVLPFTRLLLGESLDAITLFGVGVLAVALLGGATATGAGGGSWRRGLVVAVQLLLTALPSAAALACVLALSGSLRLDDIVDAQGGFPWRWALVRTPFAPALLLLFLAPLLVTFAEYGSFLRPAALRHSVAPWALTLLLCVVGTALFAGGWRVPWLDPEVQAASFGAQLLGAILFLVKTGALVVAAAWIRTHVPLVGLSVFGSSVLGRVLLPGAVLGALATWGWLAWDPDPFVRDVGHGITASTVLVGIVYASWRLLRSSAPPLRAHVSPFV